MLWICCLRTRSADSAHQRRCYPTAFFKTVPATAFQTCLSAPLTSHHGISDSFMWPVGLRESSPVKDEELHAVEQAQHSLSSHAKKKEREKEKVIPRRCCILSNFTSKGCLSTCCDLILCIVQPFFHESHTPQRLFCAYSFIQVGHMWVRHSVCVCVRVHTRVCLCE